jgi:hypothetical protein
MRVVTGMRVLLTTGKNPIDSAQSVGLLTLLSRAPAEGTGLVVETYHTTCGLTDLIAVIGELSLLR